MSALRAGLYVLLAFGVLAYGAADPWASSVLEIGSAILLLCWAFVEFRNPEAKIQWVSLACPLAAFLLIGVFQLLFHGTANAFYTRTELMRAVSAFLTFFLVAQAFRTRTDLSQLAWFIILLSFSVSLFAIIQHFSSNGKIYWFQSLQVPGEFFGPYVNRNHFAGFVELTMPVGLALIAFRGVRRDLVPLVTLLVIIPVGAIVLSGSRAGIISAVFQIVALLLLARSRRAAYRGQIAALAAATIAAVMLISWLGTGTTVERFSALRPGGDVSMGRRLSMARGALHIFYDHPIKGCGLGALVDVYPRYETLYDGRTVDHVHNDYVEALAETGILGGLCGAAFLWLLFRDARRNFTAEQGHLSRALHGGAIVAVTGILLHSFVDFNLHIPANAALFLVQSYVATSPAFPSASQAISPRRAAGGEVESA
jgi:O-antigen ligase